MQDVSTDNFIISNREELFSYSHTYGDRHVSNILSAPELAPPKRLEVAELFKNNHPYTTEERIYSTLQKLYVAINTPPFLQTNNKMLTLIVPHKHQKMAEQVISNCTILSSRIQIRSSQELTTDTWYLSWIEEFYKILNITPVQLHSWPSGQKIDPTLTNLYLWRYIIALEEVESIMK